MRDYQSFEVRNVSVIGHSGAGKTSVLEAMLYYTKATSIMYDAGNVIVGIERNNIGDKK